MNNVLVFDISGTGGLVSAPIWPAVWIRISFVLFLFQFNLWLSELLLCKQQKWLSLINHHLKVLLQDTAVEGNSCDLESLQSWKTFCHWNNNSLCLDSSVQEENKLTVTLNVEVSFM